MGLLLQVLLMLGTASLLHAVCPPIPAINIDEARFEGKWYQVEWLNTGEISKNADASTECMSVTYTSTGNGSFNSELSWRFQFGSGFGYFFLPAKVSGKMTRVSDALPNHFKTNRVTWLPLGLSVQTAHIYVLDTDYKYAVLYSCIDFGNGLPVNEMAWILHRKIAGWTNRKRNNVLKKIRKDSNFFFLDTVKFSKSDQSGCTADVGGVGNSTTPDPVATA